MKNKYILKLRKGDLIPLIYFPHRYRQILTAKKFIKIRI